MVKIGIFDSGIGGLSIVQEIITVPGFEFIYFADTLHMPYGKRAAQEIQALTYKGVQQLVYKGCSIVIIACHTASTNALAYLKEQFPAIYFIDVVALIIQQALTTTKNGIIGIIGTEATIATQLHKKELLHFNPQLKIIEKACPQLATAIENEYSEQNKIASLLDSYLETFLPTTIDTLLLGCTHYALIKELILRYFNASSIILVSPESSVRELLIKINNNIKTPSHIQWLVTGNYTDFKKIIGHFGFTA